MKAQKLISTISTALFIASIASYVNAATIESFTAAPPTIGVGGTSTLAWTTTNATSVAIDNGVAAQVQMAWDSHSASDVAGYKLYYGQTSSNYQSTVDVGNQTTYPLSGLAEGQTYYFAVTAYDASGNESDFSNEMSTTILDSGPPTDGSIGVSPGATTTYTLTATGPGGSVTAPVTVTVVPVAVFSASPTAGPAPLAVTFADASTGTIASWAWDFGDGGTSTEPNPSHTYAAPGTYPVSLMVTGPGGSSDTET